jgi:hypothetical protein
VTAPGEIRVDDLADRLGEAARLFWLPTSGPAKGDVRKSSSGFIRLRWPQCRTVIPVNRRVTLTRVLRAGRILCCFSLAPESLLPASTRYEIWGSGVRIANLALAVIVPLVWARCGIVGERVRIECPLCARRVCALYFLDGRIACRHCNGLWYGAQRTSAKGRKFRAMKNVRRKLGDYGQLWAAKVPPKPRGMWRRTYARHCAALARIERKLFV